MRWPRKPSALVVLFVVVSAVTVIADTLSVEPTALGTVANAWSNVGGADKIASVATNDGDTSYIESNTGAQGQWFALPTLSFSSSAIASVNVKAFCREIAAAEVQPRLRVNGTNYSGTSTGVPNGASYSVMPWAAWTTNPNTGAAWVEADVKGTGSNPLQECGIQSAQVGVGDEVRCTHVYIEVDYTAAAATGAPRMLLLGVGDEWR
jgi:hypothetical protein